MSWLLTTSVFHHLAAAPAQTPDVAQSLGLCGAGIAMAAAGAAAFARRDQAGD